MNLILTAFLLGIVGSFHCIGMCGPIALALPFGGKKNKGIQKNTSALLYNGGRIFTYACFGFIFGLFSKIFFIAGLQQALSIVIGILILAFTLIPSNLLSSQGYSAGIFSFMTKIKLKLSSLFLQKNKSSLLLIGLLNGLLPCGLVYVAIAGAVASGSEWKGALFMLLFGFGTFPVMMSVTLIRNMISMPFRSKIRKATPYLVSLMALMMIARGLNLDIPYLSPKINKETKIFNSCCEKKNSTCCKIR